MAEDFLGGLAMGFLDWLTDLHVERLLFLSFHGIRGASVDPTQLTRSGSSADGLIPLLGIAKWMREATQGKVSG